MIGKIILPFTSILLFAFVTWTGSFSDLWRVTAAVFTYGLAGFFLVKSNKNILRWAILYLPNITFVIFLFYSKWIIGTEVRFYQNIPWILIVPAMIFLGCELRQLVDQKKIRLTLFVVIMILLPVVAYFGTHNYFNFIYGSRKHQVFPSDLLTFHENGEVLNRKEWEGKIVLLEAWTRTCAICIKEMPNLNKVFLHYRNQPDILIYSLYLPLKGDQEEVMKSWFGKLQYDFPFIYSDMDFQSFTKEFDIYGVPKTFLIDKRGKIVYKGSLNADKTDLVYNIYRLIDAQDRE